RGPQARRREQGWPAGRPGGDQAQPQRAPRALEGAADLRGVPPGVHAAALDGPAPAHHRLARGGGGGRAPAGGPAGDADGGGGAQASRAIATLEQARQAETDPRVLEGLTLAMQEASKIPKAQVEGMRDVSTLSLARAVSAKAADRTIGPWADPAFRRAILAVRT